MARKPRHGLAAQCGALPELQHITSRGIGGLPLFRCDADRLKFLSLLAFYAREQSVVVHVFCLMTNHFHLLVEDPRRNLSAFVKGIKQSYARYFNDARGLRGAGHVFGDRFWNEPVASARSYDRLASYILLNPLRCDPKLAATAEAYPWSSAVLHASRLAAPAHFAGLLRRAGGADALLARWPRPSRRDVALRARAQLEALLDGAWIAPEAARCGRSPEQMRRVLREREGAVAAGRQGPRARGRGARAGRRAKRRLGRTSVARRLERIPRVTARFTGHAAAAIGGAIRDACEAQLPPGFPHARAVAAYLLWRFARGTARELARASASAADVVARRIEQVRALRRGSPAWAPLLWRLEWRVQGQVRSAPWRA